MQVVIYAFRSPGSGSVYIGKHECDPTGWPRRGNGRLPDGYDGSGLVVPRFHSRHGDRVEWRILATVPVAVWQKAERRAIHLARLFLGKRCVNISAGGKGFTSDVARTMGPRIREAHARPEVKQKHKASLRAAYSKPEVRRKLSDALRAAAQTPERREQLARATEANRTPEATAKKMRTRSINNSWRVLAELEPALFTSLNNE